MSSDFETLRVEELGDRENLLEFGFRDARLLREFGFDEVRITN